MSEDDDVVIVKSGSLGSVIIGVVNLLATGALAAFVVMQLQAPPKTDADLGDAGPEGQMPSAPADPNEPGPLVKLDDFVVQLRNPEFDRYVRVTFHIEVNDKTFIVDVEKSAPRIRDRFIKYFSDRTYEELRGSRGLERAKKELFVAVREVTPPNTVRALLITNFVVQ